MGNVQDVRNRLILSYILPPMIVIPLMGLAIVYAIETQYLLPSISRELKGDAALLAQFALSQKGVFADSQDARAFLEQLQPDPRKRIMLLSPTGRLLASNDPADAALVNQVLQTSGLADAEAGKPVELINFSRDLHGEVVDVFAPVLDPDRSIAGIIRISYRVVSVSDELLQLRYLIAGILALGLISGAILGLLLALNILSPIRQVTLAIKDLAGGNRWEKLAERGPDELRQLLSSVNYLVERLHNLELSRRQLLANLVHELGHPLIAAHGDPGCPARCKARSAISGGAV